MILWCKKLVSYSSQDKNVLYIYMIIYMSCIYILLYIYIYVVYVVGYVQRTKSLLLLVITKYSVPCISKPPVQLLMVLKQRYVHI